MWFRRTHRILFFCFGVPHWTIDFMFLCTHQTIFVIPLHSPNIFPLFLHLAKYLYCDCSNTHHTYQCDFSSSDVLVGCWILLLPLIHSSWFLLRLLLGFLYLWFLLLCFDGPLQGVPRVVSREESLVRSVLQGVSCSQQSFSEALQSKKKEFGECA